jgi:hypothetical protein
MERLNLCSFPNTLLENSNTLINLSCRIPRSLGLLACDDLPTNLQRTIEDTMFVAYHIEAQTPKEVRYSIFNRINTGGLSRNPLQAIDYHPFFRVANIKVKYRQR